MKVFCVLICALLASCATDAPHAAGGPRDLAGTKLEFTDLHSANTYEFLPGGRYRFAALSQNGLHTDQREGTYVGKRSGRFARIILDKDEVMHLAFEAADKGTCKFGGDARIYRFRLASSQASDSPN
jgi:hypothetical protein